MYCRVLEVTVVITVPLRSRIMLFLDLDFSAWICSVCQYPSSCTLRIFTLAVILHLQLYLCVFIKATDNLQEFYVSLFNGYDCWVSVI